MPGTRERIEQAAVAEFGQFGFHGARVQRIADRAAVNKQLIYHYFGSKRQLHDHAMRLAAQRIEAGAGRGRATGTATPADRLRERIQAVTHQLRAQPDLVRAALLGTADSDPPGTAIPNAAAEIGRQVAAEVSRGQGLGYFRDDADPTECGRHAAVLLLGWVALERVMESTEPATATADPAWIDSVVALLSRSLTW